MHLALSGLRSIGNSFESFPVERATLKTDDTKSLYSVLRDLGDKGVIDSYFSGNTLMFKSSNKGKEELLNSQIKGDYDIEFSNDQLECGDFQVQRQIFYRAFRRLLLSRGFSTGIKPTARRRSSPSYDNQASKSFVLGVNGDNIFLQGFRYLLEIRKHGDGILWLDPMVSIFNKFSGKFLTKQQIISSGLTLEMKRLSVLEPHVRLSKAQSIVSHLSSADSLDIYYTDGSKISFSKNFIGKI